MLPVGNMDNAQRREVKTTSEDASDGFPEVPISDLLPFSGAD